MEIASDAPFSHVSFLRERPLAQRVEHLAVYVLTLCSLGWYSMCEESSPYLTVAGCLLALGLVLCAALFLSQEWFVGVRRYLSFSDVSTPEAASHVYVQPEEGVVGAAKQVARILRLEAGAEPPVAPYRSKAVGQQQEGEGAGGLVDMRATARGLLEGAPYRFSVNGAYYEVRGSGKGEVGARTPPFTVSPLPMPQDSLLTSYMAWRGWETHTAATVAAARYGSNRVEVPVPKFFELAWEHAVAPFFVFQVGCVGLWALDEYVWYSLFSLSMFMMMEGMLVHQRITTSKHLRGMRPPLCPVYVFRGGNWSVVRGEDIVPLDVISIAQSSPQGSPLALTNGPMLTPQQQQQHQHQQQQHTPCPADVLLLSGTVVVNEAMLTGESTPQLKECIGSFLEESGGADKAKLNAFAQDGDHSHSRSIVFAGTLVMATDAPTVGGKDGGGAASTAAAAAAIPPPPNGGCPGIVVRTGAYTAQGELMRSIQGAGTGRASVDTDAYLFLGVMLIFALGASGYVLHEGLADPTRDRWKLVLHCIMIITTVIPPELPIELSLCTNASLQVLVRRGIFCTDPTRIPKAGNVDLVAFDKTGTLTADEFTVQAVVFPGEVGVGVGGGGGGGGAVKITEHIPTSSPPDSRLVLVGCHALMSLKREVHLPQPFIKPAGWTPPPPTIKVELAGEPMEKAALRALGWTVGDKGVTHPLPPPPPPPPATTTVVAGGAAGQQPPPPPPPPPPPYSGPGVKVVRRWAFSSALRRMACLVEVKDPSVLLGSGGSGGEGGGKALLPGIYSVCKGAPEALETLLTSGGGIIPPGYTATHTSLSTKGSRVLALAYKHMPSLTPGNAKGIDTLSREEAERGLTFAGFLVASCALKTDSERAVRELQAAECRVVMITGDSPLTALAVARQLKMGPPQSPFLGSYAVDVVEGGEGEAAHHLHCSPIDTGDNGGEAYPPSTPPFTVPATSLHTSLATLPKGALVCTTGRALAKTAQYGGPSALAALVYTTSVFARVSPSQKEVVIGVLETGGGSDSPTTSTTSTSSTSTTLFRPYRAAMVGDGSNDTGALKRASVGLAVISNPELERAVDDMRLKERVKKEEQYAQECERYAKLGTTFLEAFKKNYAARLSEDEVEEEGEEMAALLKPERERTAALRGKVEGEEEGEGGILGSALKSMEAQAAAAAAASPNGGAGAAGAGGVGGSPSPPAQLSDLQKRLKELNAEASAEGGLGMGPPVAQLGDASMAAPLTSKLPTPLSIVEVLRQGRCTLVTTHTMFKILAVNSLTASYTLSVLYLNDVKTGDSQATFAGILSSALFFAISFAKPLRRLSPERPPSRVLNRRLILTVCLQTICHVCSLILAAKLAGGYEPDPLGRDGAVGNNSTNSTGGGGRGTAALPPTPAPIHLDEEDILGSAAAAVGAAVVSAADKMLEAAIAPSPEPSIFAAAFVSNFKPNKINTAVWLLTTACQAATFVTSYHGLPFMAPLNRSTTLLYGTLAIYTVTVLGALGWISILNSYFQLVPLESPVARWCLAGLIIGDGAICYFVDRIIRAIPVPT